MKCISLVPPLHCAEEGECEKESGDTAIQFVALCGSSTIDMHTHASYRTRRFIGEANLFERSNWRILYWRFELPCLSSQVSSWLYGCVHIVINYWQIYNIGKFSEKSPIANINSLPINRLVQ